MPQPYLPPHEDPTFAFTSLKITVRDIAAMQLGSLLKTEEEPAQKWTAKQWTTFRTKVRAALPPANN